MAPGSPLPRARLCGGWVVAMPGLSVSSVGRGTPAVPLWERPVNLHSSGAQDRLCSPSTRVPCGSDTHSSAAVVRAAEGAGRPCLVDQELLLQNDRPLPPNPHFCFLTTFISIVWPTQLCGFVFFEMDALYASLFDTSSNSGMETERTDICHTDCGKNQIPAGDCQWSAAQALEAGAGHRLFSGILVIPSLRDPQQNRK